MPNGCDEPQCLNCKYGHESDAEYCLKHQCYLPRIGPIVLCSAYQGSRALEDKETVARYAEKYRSKMSDGFLYIVDYLHLSAGLGLTRFLSIADLGSRFFEVAVCEDAEHGWVLKYDRSDGGDTPFEVGSSIDLVADSVRIDSEVLHVTGNEMVGYNSDGTYRYGPADYIMVRPRNARTALRNWLDIYVDIKAVTQEWDTEEGGKFERQEGMLVLAGHDKSHSGIRLICLRALDLTIEKNWRPGI